MAMYAGCEVYEHEEENAIFGHVQTIPQIQNAKHIFPSSMRYTVQYNDTYTSLANRCLVHVDQIFRLNASLRIEQGDLLNPGQVIRVPFPSCTPLYR